MIILPARECRPTLQKVFHFMPPGTAQGCVAGAAKVRAEASTMQTQPCGAKTETCVPPSCSVMLRTTAARRGPKRGHAAGPTAASLPRRYNLFVRHDPTGRTLGFRDKHTSKHKCIEGAVPMRILRAMALCGSVALIAGCAASGVQVSDQQAQSFRVGHATYGDVVAQLGEPTTVTTSNNGQ